jgi:hypothetical protein
MLVMPASLVTLEVEKAHRAGSDFTSPSISITVPGRAGRASALSRDMARAIDSSDARKKAASTKGSGSGSGSGGGGGAASGTTGGKSGADPESDGSVGSETMSISDDGSEAGVGHESKQTACNIAIEVDPGVVYGPPTGESLRDLLAKVKH